MLYQGGSVMAGIAAAAVSAARTACSRKLSVAAWRGSCNVLPLLPVISTCPRGEDRLAELEAGMAHERNMEKQFQ